MISLDCYPNLIQKENFMVCPRKVLENVYVDELSGSTMSTISKILSSNLDLPEAGYHDRPTVQDNEPYGEIYDAARVKYFINHPDEITPIDISVWNIKDVGVVHMIDDGWHRLHAAAILGINIMCGDFYGTTDFLDAITWAECQVKVDSNYEQSD